jgi:hypothetical protein
MLGATAADRPGGHPMLPGGPGRGRSTLTLIFARQDLGTYQEDEAVTRTQGLVASRAPQRDRPRCPLVDEHPLRE